MMMMMMMINRGLWFSVSGQFTNRDIFVSNLLLGGPRGKKCFVLFLLPRKQGYIYTRKKSKLSCSPKQTAGLVRPSPTYHSYPPRRDNWELIVRQGENKEKRQVYSWNYVFLSLFFLSLSLVELTQICE